MFTATNGHTFCLATSREMFNAIQGPHSGFFLHDNLVYEEINRASGQKAWHIDEPCQVPAFANALLRDIIINHLLGDENIWAAPANLRIGTSSPRWNSVAMHAGLWNEQLRSKFSKREPRPPKKQRATRPLFDQRIAFPLLQSLFSPAADSILILILIPQTKKKEQAEKRTERNKD